MFHVVPRFALTSCEQLHSQQCRSLADIRTYLRCSPLWVRPLGLAVRTSSSSHASGGSELLILMTISSPSLVAALFESRASRARAFHFQFTGQFPVYWGAAGNVSPLQPSPQLGIHKYIRFFVLLSRLEMSYTVCTLCLYIKCLNKKNCEEF